MPHLSFRLAAAIAVFGFGVSPTAVAQDDGAAIGEWRSYLPAGYANDVTACETFVAYATQGGSVVLRYNETGEIRELNEVNALSQSDVAAVQCNPAREGQLFVIYRDGVIDVVEEEQVVLTATSIADAEIAGLRDARGMVLVDDATAVVYADFGFVFFDLAAGIFLDDVRWDEPVNDVAAFDGDLYVATANGVSVLPDYERTASLRNQAAYEPLGALLPGGILADSLSRGVNALEVWRDELYLGYEAGFVGAIGPGATQPRVADEPNGRRVVDLDGNGELLVVAYRRRRNGSDATLATADGATWTVADVEGCAGLPFAAAAIPGGGVAFAARVTRGLCRVPSPGAPCACVNLNAPYAPSAYDLAVADGRVAVASGTLNEQLSRVGTANGIYVRAGDGQWTNYNRGTSAAFGDEDRVDYLALKDIVTVAIGPTGDIYAGAYEEGLARVSADGQVVERIDERNTSLGLSTLSPSVPRVGGLAFGPDGTLWVGNTEAERPLSARARDGTWRSYGLPCGTNNLFTVVVDADSGDPRTGLVWVVDKGFGLVAFDPAGTLDDLTDDRCRSFGAADGLPASDVRSVVVDRRGTVFVGTANGTARFSGGDPFDPASGFTRPSVEVDGINGFAFDEELVRAIAVDGGNRKWVGTNSGLFLVTDNTQEILAQYTADDSPLPTDRVDALAFDEDAGLLWVGTPQGLLSLQTASTGGRELAHGAVEVFPQPVAPDYEGPIAIRGLALNADVKITDAAGRLVYETTAVGGTATWNGRDYSGRRPASGVYFVWGATAANDGIESPDGVVAKIALIR